jgi:hypothetical protein
MTTQVDQNTNHSRHLALRFSIGMASLMALFGVSGCSDEPVEQATDTEVSAPDADTSDDSIPEIQSARLCQTQPHPAACLDGKAVTLCGKGCLEVHLSATMQDRSPRTIDGRECVCKAVSFRIPQTLKVTAGDAGSGSAYLIFRDSSNGRKVTCEYRGNGTTGTKCHPGKVGDRYDFVRCDDRSRADDARKSDWFVLQVRGKGAQAARTTIAVSFSDSQTCGCKPTTCAAAKAECGSIDDGCGGKLSCGTCASPQTCGGAGVANHCGCKPATCAELGVSCGKVSDGCGGTLDCGECCKPLDACHVAGVRDPKTGVCSNPPAPDGTSCDDGNSCTSGDVCTAGTCGGTPYTCNDGLGCTSDSCDGKGGCVFAVNPGFCVGDGVCHQGGQGPEDPEPAPATINEPNATSLSSDYLGVDLRWDGRFTIGARLPRDWSTLYGWPNDPWTTSTTVRIDGQDVYFGDINKGEFVQYPYDADQQTSVATWKIGRVVVTQTLRIVNSVATGHADTVKVQYDISNTDSEAHQVGLRMLMDTMINNSDGAPFRLPGRAEPVTTETELLGSEIPEYYQSFFDTSDLVHVVQGTLSGAGATRPDRFAMVGWNDAASTPWDYTVTPGKTFGAPGYLDSAVLLYWNPQTLQAGASRRIVTYYGLGSLTGSQSLAVSGPARLSLTKNQVSPNPFTVIAYIKNTEMVSKVGETLTLAFAENNGLALAPGETAAHAMPEIPSGATLQTSWQVVPVASGTWNYSVSTATSALSAQRSVVVPQPWTCTP